MQKIYLKIALLISTCTILSAQANKDALPCAHALQGPKWVQEGVIYSVFPRNFSERGDLAGVTARIGQIKELGVNIVWLLPLQPIGEVKKKGTLGSPYSIQDYEKINPAYGTKEDLKTLVAKAHEAGLKIIVDAVLNHTAWDSVLMKHPEFYLRDGNQQIIPPMPDWSDVAALDYKNGALQNYILTVLKQWLQEFDLDGFRFDASDFVPLEFWKKVRVELLKVKPDILLLGEGETPAALCMGFDLDYDWKFKQALDHVIMDGAPATATIKGVLQEEEETFPKGSLHLRFSDNHDEKRAIARYGEKGALAASALIFTLNGVPLIYNGMEVGDITESRAPALFEKMPLFWKAEDLRPTFKPFYAGIIALRKEHPSLSQGNIKWLKNSAEERVLTYLRTTDKETLFIALNLSNQPFSGTVDLKDAAKDITPRQEPLTIPLQPLPKLSLGAWEFRIYKVSYTAAAAKRLK